MKRPTINPNWFYEEAERLAERLLAISPDGPDKVDKDLEQMIKASVISHRTEEIKFLVYNGDNDYAIDCVKDMIAIIKSS